MTLIYFKLGTLTQFSEETLDFHLGDTYPTAGVLDYTNLNPSILNAHNATEIIQINEEEYYNIINGAAPSNTTEVVNPGDLFSLTTYLRTCPLDNDIFFTLHLGKWHKIAWSKIKSCIGSRTNILFRVGSGALVDGVTVINDGQAIFQNDRLKNKNFSLKANSLELYPISVYDPAQLPDVDYYIYDPELGTINRPNKFKDQEIINITEI